MRIVFTIICFIIFTGHSAVSEVQPPSNIWVSSLGGSSVLLGWNSSSDVNKYNIYVNSKYYTTVEGKNQLRIDSLANGINTFYITSISRKEEISVSSNIKSYNLTTSGQLSSSLIDQSTPKNIKPGFQLVFSDEFNTYNINKKRWNTKKMWGPDTIVNNEKQYYVDVHGEKGQEAIGYNPFKFNGSSLSIEASRTPDNKKWMVHNQPYLSGVLTSYKKFSTKYGFFEARIKIPALNGTFPAFWLLHERLQNQNTKRSEIDIFENLGHRPDVIYNTAHYYNNVSNSYGGDHVQLKNPEVYGDDYSKGFHTYAVTWEPGHIVWYIDGRKVNEIYDVNMDHEKMYVIVNLAMGGNWVNKAEWGGLGYDFPNQYDLNNVRNPKLEIDYIRVYKKN